ncbi:MAG: 30S ribosomal protein S18 [Sphaerochaetaceae bacterium]|nr:30S ribosomal protein S18 [Sphaerochaetaceae bacterium]MDD3163888.1 30S ribosomal protein S18 [Sphaerochaetaceae bacterium]
MRDEKYGASKDEGTGYRDFKGKKDGGMKKLSFRKKICKWCTQKAEPDYKNPEALRRCITERGRILPARITGNCAKHQRAVTEEIKKARVLAYLPFDKQ